MKYLMMVIAVAAAFAMVPTSSSFAFGSSPLEKKFEAERKKQSNAAHRVVVARKYRKSDFSKLNR